MKMVYYKNLDKFIKKNPTSKAKILRNNQFKYAIIFYGEWKMFSLITASGKTKIFQNAHDAVYFLKNSGYNLPYVIDTVKRHKNENT